MKKIFTVELHFNLPWRVVLGVDDAIVHVEWCSVVEQIWLHEALESIGHRHIERRLHRLAAYLRAQPVIVAEQKARSVMSRRIQNWKFIINPQKFSSLLLFTQIALCKANGDKTDKKLIMQ